MDFRIRRGDCGLSRRELNGYVVLKVKVVAGKGVSRVRDEGQVLDSEGRCCVLTGRDEAEGFSEGGGASGSDPDFGGVQ